MRLSLWIVPTIAFVIAAAAIVQRESDDAPDSQLAASPDNTESASGLDAAPVKASRFIFDGDDDLQLAAPPGARPEPVWRIIDHGQPGDVLSPSDVPVLAISSKTTIPQVATTLLAANTPTSSTSTWEVVGHSAQGRPIHVRRYGTTGDVTLIICGLDGEDRIAVKWIDNLSQQLAAAPEQARGRQIVLLRDPNPDGLTAKQTSNDRGVELNRNFPTSQFRPGAAAGPGPASEPETRAVLEVLYRFPPKRVIHVQSAGKSEVAANPAARQLVEQLRDGRQVTVRSPDSALAAGSVEEFASSTFSAEVLTLRLATGDDWRSAAIEHFPTLMAAAVPSIASESLPVARTTRRDPVEPESDLAPSPFGAAVEITRLERQGYEELPPPPQKPTW